MNIATIEVQFKSQQTENIHPTHPVAFMSEDMESQEEIDIGSDIDWEESIRRK